MILNSGDIVSYSGEYNNCHGHKYKIVKIYPNVFGVDIWYDLESVHPNLMTHYKVLLSVEIKDIKLWKNLNN